MAKLEKLNPGQILWDYHRYQMGNTTMTTMGEWPIKVIEIDLENNRALCSWNGNKPEWIYRKRIGGYRVNRRKDFK